ncbi:MAG TPA: hypothetical protein VI564_02030, partial [Candidatus Nanoarchaeia archaeon]|nr:hypothetical protein [Candidatus Nanoarchaeia archaeon]
MLTREPDIANDITLQMNTANENCLSDLLPYDTASKTGIRLKDGLNEFLVLLTASEAAIEAFLNGNLHNFDPLVGENACQIRAIKIALIALDPPKDIPKYLQSFKRAKEKIEKFIQNVEDFSNIEMSLKSYLFNENVDFALSDDLFFLIKSFILTRTKIVLPFYKDNMPLVENAYTDSKKIKEIGKVGSSFSGELVKKARKRLSKSSAKFVQELAHNLDSSDSAKKYTTDQFAISHNGLKCLPYYWLTRVLMIKALNSAIPIVMIAQQIAKDQAYRKVENTIICF